MKILFVATRKNCDPEERELYEMDFMNQLLGFKRALLDLGLLTVAACTPPHVEVEVVDEYLTPVDYDRPADLIALSAKTSAVARAYQVAAEFRKRGRKVVLGGIHASLCPEEALEHVDYVVVGEAEKTWPQFVLAFEQGRAPRITRAQGFPPMAEVPVPSWDKIPYDDYLFHQVQSTRGCPFTCRFCSVPDISGQSFRFKPPDRIVNEVRSFPKGGWLKDRMKALYFVDDNFLSRPKHTQDLLQALIPLREKGELIDWSAETTLNVASNPELLDLFVKAGCTTLIIGFESISEATLLAMDKKVNFSLTYPEALERIHSRGLSVVGNFIVGFDTDTLSTFKDILDFVDQNQILYPFFSILTPMPGTKLHEDFKQAGRLDHLDWAQYDTRHVVFEPRNMTREQLMDGYCYLFEQAYASKRGLDRLETYWAKYRKRRSTFAENAYVGWRLKRLKVKKSARFAWLLDEGWRRLNSRAHNSDVAQLLYYFDSAHFVDFLDRYKSPDFDAHVRLFEGDGQLHVAEALRKKQWESKRGRVEAPRASPHDSP